MSLSSGHLSRACINLDNLTHNLRLLGELAGVAALWPAIKANAYGHGVHIVAEHLVSLGCNTLCVAHVGEAEELRDAGIQTKLLVLSATLPEHADALVEHGCDVTVCTLEMARALSAAAERYGRSVAVHVKVDTGMGRIGLRPDGVSALLERCRALPGLEIGGLMSHFACADAADKSSALAQLEQFRRVIERNAVPLRHMANSAALFDIPGASFEAARPGIALYGLRPSPEISNPRVRELRPVLEWKSRITFLKEVDAGVGLSYGHTFVTQQPSLIATVPVGYGDGLSRALSNNCDMLVRGVRCPQVGRITMDQSLLDVSALRDRVQPGDEVVVLGRQGDEEIRADELAEKLGTINYEVVTAIARRVPRIVIP